MILGETPNKEREHILSGFKHGRVDTLIQVGVLIEGWDAPQCKLLIDLAPTLSLVRATQKYFRVMTRYQDKEARIIVLLPKNIHKPPILPIDLFLQPGETYQVPTPEDYLLIQEQNHRVNELLEELDERTKWIIKYRLELTGDPELTWEKIGIVFDVSKERARQIFYKGAKKLGQKLMRDMRDANPVIHFQSHSEFINFYKGEYSKL